MSGDIVDVCLCVNKIFHMMVSRSGEDRRRLQEEVFDVMASVLSSQRYSALSDSMGLCIHVCVCVLCVYVCVCVCVCVCLCGVLVQVHVCHV